MREKPILMSGPMVRAILGGHKTQTRRIVKPQWPADVDEVSERPALDRVLKCVVSGHSGEWEDGHGLDEVRRCPYGQPGDRLWVRETWQFDNWTEDGYPFIGYAADKSRGLVESEIPHEWGDRLMATWAELSAEKNYAIDSRAADRKWRRSIFMPRWASRITLEIVRVRVERVQDITPSDCRAEGQPVENNDAGVRYGYGQLWNALNEKRGYGWAANPWVWVIEFRRVAT